jgi:hypothetical protein
MGSGAQVSMAAIAVGLASGCISWVGVSSGGKRVELVPSTYLATASCKEVEDLTVNANADERSSEENLSVVQVKAKNEAHRLDATHVVERETVEFSCDRKGEPDEDGNRTCITLHATAYECLVGR